MKLLHLVVAAALLAGCSSPPAQTDATQQAPTANTLIPVTSKSPEALAHLRKGEELLNNLRPAEAAEEFSQALKLDPDLVLARAYHGQAMPGADGVKELDAAAQAARNLPESERVYIEGLAADRRGDLATARSSFTRLTEIAGGDWRSHYSLGTRLMTDEKYDEAGRELKRATELNPNAGGAQNMLGYVALRQGDVDGAIAAFNEYVRILPQEPNPQDSLGEALLAAGRFKEAEAAFQRAVELSPQFWNAYQGMSYARFYAGNWAGGRDALAKAKASATRVGDKISVDTELAAAAAAQRNTADALRILDASEKTEGAASTAIAVIPVIRATILLDAGRAKEALAPIDKALKMADSGQLPPLLTRNLRRDALRARIRAEVELRDAAAAQKTAAALDGLAAASENDPLAQSAMHHGRAELALAQGDAAAAKSHFDQCSREDELCKWRAVVAAEKAKDTAAATSGRDSLLKYYRRDPLHLIIRSRLAPRTT